MTARTFLRAGTSLTRSVDGDSATVDCWVPPEDLAGLDLERLNLATLRPDIPQYLAAAPGYETLIARSVTARPVGRGVRLIIQYGPPTPRNREPDDNDAGVIETGSTMVTVRSMRDAEGQPYTLAYTYADGPYAGQTIEQLGEVEEQIPHTSVRVTRRVRTSPLDRSIQYTGGVNRFPWQGFAAETWIVAEMRGTSTDGGETYTETTELIYRPETWARTIVYQDNLTRNGAVPPDVFDAATQPLAARTIRPPRLVTFSALNLPDVTA